MGIVEHYLLIFTYPIALFIFVFGSLLAYRRTKFASALSLLIGFTMLLVGHLIKNYGPQEVTYTESGSAIIQYTFLFSLGSFLVIIGILVAAISYILFVRKSSAT